MRDLLVIERLRAGYGEAVVLPDLSLTVRGGETVALLGRNGMGKTTLINSIIGVTRRFGGTIRLDGRDVTRLRPDQRAAAGIGWVPQDRAIFGSLTVEENLTAVARPGPCTLERIYGLFSRLRERRRNLGGQLSGGEQQMLAISRALILNPRVLLLDEPFEGLAPIVVDELLAGLRQAIRDEGLCTLLVEQNVRKVVAFADRVAVMGRGSIVCDYDGAAVRADRRLIDAHLRLDADAPPLAVAAQCRGVRGARRRAADAPDFGQGAPETAASIVPPNRATGVRRGYGHAGTSFGGGRGGAAAARPPRRGDRRLARHRRGDRGEPCPARGGRHADEPDARAARRAGGGVAADMCGSRAGDHRRRRER